MQTIRMNITQEKTIKAIEVNMAVYSKSVCKREAVGVASVESAEEARSKLSYVRYK